MLRLREDSQSKNLGENLQAPNFILTKFYTNQVKLESGSNVFGESFVLESSWTHLMVSEYLYELTITWHREQVYISISISRTIDTDR